MELIKNGEKISKRYEEKEEALSNEVYRDELNLPLIEVDSLNPLKTNNSHVSNILRLIYEPLFEFGEDEKINKVLAKSYSKLDSKTYIITIKENVYMHKGGKLSIDDVIFTINTLKNRNVLYSQNVLNIDTVQKLDEYSIKLFLKEPDDFLVYKLVFPIIPEFYFGGENFDNEKKINTPCGTGRYAYKDTLASGIIILESFSDYWNKEDVKLKRVYLYPFSTYGEAVKAFKSSQIDVIVTNMADWKERFGSIGINSYGFENSEYELLIPNFSNISLSQKSVRKAILLAINREEIINSVYYNNAQITDIPLHSGSDSSTDNIEYNLEKAKQILLNDSWVKNENGWTKEIDGQICRLQFEIIVNKASEEKQEAIEIIKNNLIELGLNVNIRALSIDELKDRLQSGKFDMAFVSMDIKGEYELINSIKKGSSKNYSNCYFEKLEELADKMAINQELYDKNADSFFRMYQDELPYIGLYYKTSTILTNKSVKGNFKPNWSKPFRNIETFCK